MKLSQRDNELIQRYLSDTLNKESKMDFDRRIKDADFNAELLYQAQMLDALNEVDYLKVKSELIGSTPIGSATKKKLADQSKTQLWKWLSLFSAILLLLFIGWKGYQNATASKNTHLLAELADEYSTPYPVTEIERGKNNPNGTLSAGMTAYANSQWQEAYSAFDKIIPQTDRISIYKANCLIQLNQYQGAKDLLLIIKTDISDLTQNVSWYLAICELGLENKAGAIKQLTDIASQKNHMFNAKAKVLITKLD